MLDRIRYHINNFTGINEVIELHKKQMSRVEVLRNEILFEMKYMHGNRPNIDTRIINYKKYNKFINENELILNIGCGNNYIEDMVNIDIRELPNVDVVADAACIQLPENIAKGVYSAHVLEHFPHEHLRRSVLPNWVALLRKGGFFRAIVPDAEGMIEAFSRGEMSFEDLRTVTFGLQEYEGDMHHTMFSRESFKVILEEAGLRDVHYVATSRANGLCLEMEVLAYR